MRYLVKLKPVEPFFFGGENTFGKDDTRGDRVRYSAQSTYFPQQTALLGMLRKTLLIQNGHMTMHKNGEWVDSKGGRKGNDQNYLNAVNLVGKESFSYENTSDLGSIKNISPIFITQNNEAFLVNAKDASYEPKISTNSKMLIGSREQNTFVLDGFDTKVYKKKDFISLSKNTLNIDKIFETIQTVGICKAKDEATKEDGFFQKTAYMLKEGAYFTFYLEVESKLNWEKAYVTLGADNSSFMLELTETNESFEEKFQNIFKAKNISRLVLTSETLLSQEAYDMCHFVFGDRKTYRQLTSNKGNKSKRYYLLERGSVLYSDDIEKLSAALGQPHLRKVGINQFITTQGA